jgi:hypothetical protein
MRRGDTEPGWSDGGSLNGPSRLGASHESDTGGEIALAESKWCDGRERPALIRQAVNAVGLSVQLA